LLNATVGLQRIFRRRQPTQRRTSLTATRRDVHPGYDSPWTRYSSPAAAAPAASRARVTSGRRFSRPSLRLRLGHEALLPFAVILIVVVATLASTIPGVVLSDSVGGPTGDGQAPRLGVGTLAGGAGAGGNDGSGPTDAGAADSSTGVAYANGIRGIDRATLGGPAGGVDGNVAAIRGPFLPDGTLVKPMAVDTSIADGRGLLRKYKVVRGDTLTAIAKRFDVSVKTIWWANSLSATKPFKVGMTLTIPPVDGVVVTVAEGDTLDSVAAHYEVDPQAIYALNGLEDAVLVAGQMLILPGAVGTGIPIVTVPRKPIATHPSSGGSTVRPPATYSGGKFSWPVVGGNNFISQYYHAGHYAIDIAADYGTRVVAAASGAVIFAGWKANGGGYQVWVAHGSGLYTTYNHMSAISVGIGQSVGRGQQVGRVGQTGNATGPHLHFEVWRGPVWDGGIRVNPLLYL
jgi:murein DD-endopeptidase MepM/ murein hydrolase activator NlpD